MVSCGQVACKGSVGPATGEVIVVVVGSSWAVRSTAIVEAAEDVETLAVDIKVEDHHNEEVHQAEQQHSLANPLQGPAQHQPAHGQSHTARSATRIRSTSPLRAAEPSWTAIYKKTPTKQKRGELDHTPVHLWFNCWVRSNFNAHQPKSKAQLHHVAKLYCYI